MASRCFLGWVVPGFLSGMIGALCACVTRASDESQASKGVSFAGRVVDLETKKPVHGASVAATRSLPGIDPKAWPAWAGTTTVMTDGDGRFQVAFPPEQVAEKRLAVVLAVSHRDYIGRK